MWAANHNSDKMAVPPQCPGLLPHLPIFSRRLRGCRLTGCAPRSPSALSDRRWAPPQRVPSGAIGLCVLCELLGTMFDQNATTARFQLRAEVE